jgi:hypothetical protein
MKIFASVGAFTDEVTRQKHVRVAIAAGGQSATTARLMVPEILRHPSERSTQNEVTGDPGRARRLRRRRCSLGSRHRETRAR